jgi:hypothetical protein
MLTTDDFLLLISLPFSLSLSLPLPHFSVYPHSCLHFFLDRVRLEAYKAVHLPGLGQGSKGGQAGETHKQRVVSVVTTSVILTFLTSNASRSDTTERSTRSFG